MTATSPQPLGTQPARPLWLRWAVFPVTSRLADIGGTWVHYIDEGSGPALLLVSAGQWSFMFSDVILRLRGAVSLPELDFPGCGPVSADLSSCHSGRNSERTSFSVLRRSGYLQRRDLHLVGQKVATAL